MRQNEKKNERNTTKASTEAITNYRKTKTLRNKHTHKQRVKGNTTLQQVFQPPKWIRNSVPGFHNRLLVIMWKHKHPNRRERSPEPEDPPQRQYQVPPRGSLPPPRSPLISIIRSIRLSAETNVRPFARFDSDLGNQGGPNLRLGGRRTPFWGLGERTARFDHLHLQCLA